MYRIIVVAGDVGTGTTTLAKSLVSKLNWQYLSSGDLYRAFVLEHNIPLWDHTSFPDEVDKEIDNKFFQRMFSEKNIVFDTHYGGWFARDLKDVFRILLFCDPKVANQRMLNRKHTHQETVAEIEKRRIGNYAKFKKLYSNDDYQDPKFYNLVIDTGKNSAEKTFALAYKAYLKG